MFEIREKPEMVERAMLVSIYFDPSEAGEKQAMLDELEDLVSNLGIGIAGKHLIKSRDMHAKFLCGTGKAQEVKQLALDCRADCVVFDNMLSPSQQREWERLVDECVIDREEVILDIFARRARTREATLQVELARMQYSLPRMARMWNHLDRQGGGSGGGKGGGGAARGEGEKQIEVDRRLARARIEAIQRELVLVTRQRATQRKERERQAVATAAIVGYTNAGKSSLLSLVSGSEVMARDMLFATLDTTTRKIELPHGQPLLLTDTVGFIRNLPHRITDALRVGEPLDTLDYNFEGILTDGEGHPLYTDIQGTPGSWDVDVISPTTAVIRNVYLGDLLPDDLESYLASSLNLSPENIIETEEFDDDEETQLVVYDIDGVYLRIETRAAVAPNGLEGPLMSIIATKTPPL